MKNKLKYLLAFLLCQVFSIIGCKKDFLDKKPATNINVPSTIADLQLLLDNTPILNVSPGLGEVSSDDFEIGYTAWLNLISPIEKSTYIWDKDLFQGQGNIQDWNAPYTAILTTNVVLEQVDKLSRNTTNSRDIDNLKGSALFMRAFLFFDLSQTFSLPYDKVSASTDLGIPMRLVADVNAPSSRSSIEAAYNQILSDALHAKILLKENYINSDYNHPTKAASYGFLSRVYLTMHEYSKAGLYADSALKLHNSLIDYNQVSKTTTTPFPLLTNSEIVYDSQALLPYTITQLFRGTASFSIIASLYNSFDDNDLRKVLYFNKTPSGIYLKVGYAGQRGLANSIATDDLYLIRAECNARTGNTNEAMADLNTLMKMRWSNTVPYPTFTASSAEDALRQILVERRKELIMRGLRWNDIRRLNKEGYNITLTRNLNGTIYTLPPNDPRYALPIPPDVIARSGIEQNNR